MDYIRINLVTTFAIESMIVVVTPKNFEPLDGLGPLPYSHTHNKIYIQIGI
jgi:hypothetical protein